MGGIASSFSGGAQAYAEGILSQRLYNRQAQITEQEGVRAEKELIGRQKTLYAKAGVDISSEGSPLEIMTYTKLEMERETKEKAEMERWYGRLAKKAGRMAFYSGMVSGGVGISSMVAGGIQGAAGGGGFMGGLRGSLGMGGGGGGGTNYKYGTVNLYNYGPSKSQGGSSGFWGE